MTIVWPIADGELVVATPTSFKAANLASAVPLPPAMIAPAWPILLPGGAVAPAMNATTGFGFV